MNISGLDPKIIETYEAIPGSSSNILPTDLSVQISAICENGVFWLDTNRSRLARPTPIEPSTRPPQDQQVALKNREELLGQTGQRSEECQ